MCAGVSELQAGSTGLNVCEEIDINDSYRDGSVPKSLRSSVLLELSVA